MNLRDLQNDYRRFTARLAELTLRTLSDRRFFIVIVALLVLQAAWIALTARYPMAFDENFHFGLIQVYANKLTPFFTEAPPGSGVFGPLTRDPSYLYHYLLSFPYRLLASIVTSQETQIIVFRLLNIGFFVAGLAMFFKLLIKTGISRAMTNFVLLVFVLIPVVPMLAAHVNYDNVMFFLVPVALLITLNIREAIVKRSTLPALQIMSLAVFCLFASLVKYAFLPIAVVLFGYLLLAVILYKRKAWRRIAGTFWPGIKAIQWPIKVLLIIGLIIGGGLAFERYGVNVINYRMVVPDCGKVLDFKHCSQYGPWKRNYDLATQKTEPVDPNPIPYTINWFGGMLHRLFFAINSDYRTKLPLPIPFYAAQLAMIVGLALIIIYWRRLLRRPIIPVFALLVIAYGATLFFRSYGSFMRFGEMVAINGRYFIPLLPLILVIVALAAHEYTKRLKNPLQTKALLACIACLLLLQGAGVMTFILRSEPHWYWESNSIALGMNTTAQHVLRPFILEGPSE